MITRKYETDIIAIALLYRKIYAGTDILSYNKIREFYEAITANLKKIEDDLVIISTNEGNSQLYFKVTDENNKICTVINPNANLKAEWEHYICSLPFEISIASEMDNSLKEIGLITVKDKIVDRVSYYNELRKKYNLVLEALKVPPEGISFRSGFDFFRDWEGIPENSWEEYFCISDSEQLALKELRENKRLNNQNIEKQLNSLKRTRKK